MFKTLPLALVFVLVMIAISQPIVDAAPPRPVPTATPTLNDDLLYPYTLEGLRARSYPGGTITVREVWKRTSDFSGSYISYPSDGLNISGVMYMPKGEGPFPVIILLHGYYSRRSYWSGMGTRDAAEYFARHGYITIAPDLRGWGLSDEGASLFTAGLVTDTLNLISSLSSLPQADPERVGLWGHSMGGGITTKVLVVDDRVKAAVLHAPNSADDADIINRWGAGCLPDRRNRPCNPGDVVAESLPEELVDLYFEATTDIDRLIQVAPIYHLRDIDAPIQIHIGTEDGKQRGYTPPEWSEKLYNALRTAGKEVDYFSYAGQEHFFTGDSWTLMMQRALTFFDTRL